VPPAVWIVLVVAVLVAIGALAWSIRRLAQRLGQLGSDLDELQRQLTPALHQLERDGDVTAAELAAINDRLEDRARAAATRRRRRWRPGPS
jgi:cell division protein FtsB